MLPVSCIRFLRQKQHSISYIKNFVRSIQTAQAGVSTMSTIEDKFQLPKRYAGSSKSVWVEYIQLAADYKPLDLGQGFADFHCPEHVTKALAEVTTSANPLLQQYTRGFGHPRLIKVLGELYSKQFKRQINPQTELLVTSGAYEALYASIIGHVDDGDEVIIIEPFFDCYEPMVKTAGGICKFIPLRFKPSSDNPTSADYKLDRDELSSLFNAKTKMIIVNTPNNPLGKVFTEKELTVIADLCKKWNVMCVSDEVYEWMVFKPNEHFRIANLPGMWERTITIGSAGKTFSITGWKTGWAFGPANLMTSLFMVHQNCVYTCNTPIQEAIAIAFEQELQRYNSDDSYFVSLAQELVIKRDFMAKFLKDAGMKPILPEGGFFMIADWSPLESKVDMSSENDKYKDYRFTKWMTKNLGLQGIPPTAFYSEANKVLAEQYVRYCFIKKDEKLQLAANILKEWKTK